MEDFELHLLLGIEKEYIEYEIEVKSSIVLFNFLKGCDM